MFNFLTLSCSKYTLEVPQEQNVAKNLYVEFSEAGFMHYTQGNIVRGFENLLGSRLNDLHFKVAGYSFSLTNIIVKGLQSPTMDVMLLEKTQQVWTSFNDLGMSLSFEFHMSHDSYYYQEDSGTGALLFVINNMRFLAQVDESLECPGALYINSTDTSARIERLSISFDSKMGYLLDSIIPFITDYLCEYLNEEFAGTIVDQILGLANKEMGNFTPLGHYYKHGTLSTDQRWVGGFTILDRQFRTSASGAVCLRDEENLYCAGTPAYDSPPRCNYAINADVTYEVSSNVFNQLLAYLWQLNSSYFAETFNVTQISVAVKRVVNTGVVVEIQYEKDGATNTIEALAHAFSEPKQWEGSTEVLAYFGLSIYKVIDPGALHLPEATQFALNLNYILKEFGYTIDNGFQLNLTNARIVYCDANWIFFGVQVNSYAS